MRYLSILCLVVLAGCTGPKIFGHGPYAESDVAHREGIRYYLPKHIVRVDATVNETLAIDSSTLDVVTDAEASGDVKLEVVADHGAYYVLDMSPGNASVDELTVGVTPTGLLQNVNARSEGRFGNVIQGVASFLGPLRATGRIRRAIKLSSKSPVLLDTFRLVEKALLLEEQGEEFQSALERFAAQAPGKVRAIADLVEAREAYNEITALEDMLKELLPQRRAAFKAYIQKHPDAKSALDELDGRITSIRKELENARKDLETIANQHAESLGVGRKTKVDRTFLFEIGELPLIDPNSEDDLTAQVELQMEQPKFWKAQQMSEYGVIVAITAHPKTMPNSHALPNGASGEARIFYRQPYPAYLVTFTRQKDDEEGFYSWKPYSFESESILDPAFEPLYFVFEPSDFGTNGLTLAFDEFGQLKELTRKGAEDGRSSAERAVGSLSQAGQTVRRGLQESGDAREYLDRKRLERLQQELDLIEARRRLEEGRNRDR